MQSQNNMEHVEELKLLAKLGIRYMQTPSAILVPRADLLRYAQALDKKKMKPLGIDAYAQNSDQQILSASDFDFPTPQGKISASDYATTHLEGLAGHITHFAVLLQ